MKTDRHVFPAIFFREGNVVGVRFPDLPGCNTCGDDQEDALTMARDALGGHLLCLEDLGEAIPTPTPFDKIRTKKNEVVALIEVRLSILREEDRKRAVNKTVTVPAWLNQMAMDAHINFSSTLQEALRQKLGV